MKLRYPPLIAALWIAGTIPASADVSIAPRLIDIEIEPRQSVTRDITLRNSYDSRTATLYATVNQIAIDNTGSISEFVPPVMTDRETDVTSWISINRGRISLPAGETTAIPLTVQTHPNTPPGVYHAFIGLTQASNRAIAEAAALAGDAPGLILKVTVPDTRVESIRIAALESDRFVFDESDKTLTLTVTNEGQRAINPQGEVVFYDARGREIAAAPVNTYDQIIGVSEELVLTVPLPDTVPAGRVSANALLTYGEQRATVFASTSFLAVPWWIFLVLGVGMLAVLLLLLSLLRTRAVTDNSEHGESVAMYVGTNRDHETKDHDIDLANNN
jgi:hypothetical protein